MTTSQQSSLAKYRRRRTPIGRGVPPLNRLQTPLACTDIPSLPQNNLFKCHLTLSWRKADIILEEFTLASTCFYPVSQRFAQLSYAHIEQLCDWKGTDNHLGGNASSDASRTSSHDAVLNINDAMLIFMRGIPELFRFYGFRENIIAVFLCLDSSSVFINYPSFVSYTYSFCEIHYKSLKMKIFMK